MNIDKMCEDYTSANSDNKILRVFIVRHGQTDYNLAKILQGHLNISINEEGHLQAIKLGEKVKDYEWDAIITSDLDRCQQTLNRILERSNSDNKAVEISSDFRERMMGPVQGMKVVEAREKFGDSFRDQGERRSQMLERVTKEWNRFTQDCIDKKYKNVLVMTHGGVIKALVQWMGDNGYEMMDESLVPFNTSLTIVEFGDGIKRVCKVGDTQHLNAEKQLRADQLAL